VLFQGNLKVELQTSFREIYDEVLRYSETNKGTFGDAHPDGPTAIRDRFF